MVKAPGLTKSRRRLFLAAAAGMFVFGITLAMLGALFGLPAVRERMHADLAQQGDIFLILYLGILVSTIIVGPIIDSFGNKIVLMTSAVFVVAGLLGFVLARSFLSATLAAAALGFGGGGLNTAANALVADLYPDDRGAMLNLLGVFFGVGALLVPLLAASITSQVLIVATALAIGCTIFYAILPFPPARASEGFSIFASIRAVKYPGVLLFAFLLFCESGNESAIGGWTSTYAGSLGAPPRIATWILAAYWAGLMIGRVAGARLLATMRKERLVFASGIGSAIGTAVLLGGPTLITLAIGAAIVGLSFAAIYPTTLAIAADRYQRLAGTIFGLLFAVGLVGGMLFPFAIGHLSEHYGMGAAMVLPLVGAVVIVVVATALECGGLPPLSKSGAEAPHSKTATPAP